VAVRRKSLQWRGLVTRIGIKETQHSMCMGNSLVNDELKVKSKWWDDIAKTRMKLVSEAKHNSSVSCPVTGICLAYDVNSVCSRTFLASSQNFGERLLAFSCFSIRPSARMQQLGCRRTDSYEIWHLMIFRKSVQKIKVLLKSDKNIGYVKWRPTYVFDHIAFSSS
jgi:hypothetical protein